MYSKFSDMELFRGFLLESFWVPPCFPCQLPSEVFRLHALSQEGGHIYEAVDLGAPGTNHYM